MSSKTARLHRRQAANKRKYARLRKAGRVPQHTQAERRRASIERQHQREADQYRETWLRRARLPVAVTVSGAAASVVFGAARAPIGIRDVYRPYAVAAQGYPWVASLGSDPGDPPHVPEPDMTFYSSYGGPGTARADTRVEPVPAATWDSWGWTYSPNVLGD